MLKGETGEAIATIMSDPAGLADHILTVAGKLLGGVTMAVFVLAAADLVWSRFHWRRNLRMSRQDLKDEMKQLQGGTRWSRRGSAPSRWSGRASA